MGSKGENRLPFGLCNTKGRHRGLGFGTSDPEFGAEAKMLAVGGGIPNPLKRVLRSCVPGNAL